MYQNILRLELEGLKQNVAHSLHQHNDMLNEMISNELEVCLSEEWVTVEIQKVVRETVRSTISNMVNNWQVQKAIEDVMGETISKTITQGSSEDND